MEKNIQELIREKERFFSKGKKRICTYITEECEKAAFMTAANLGKAVGVSESTVVRFAMELGYDGYPDMQNALQQMLIIRVKQSGNASKNSEKPSGENMLSVFMRNEAENVYHASDMLDENTYKTICNCLRDCKTVFLLGTGHAAHIAEFMKSYMCLLHPSVQPITVFRKKDLIEQLFFADAMDAALLFGFPSDDEEMLYAAQLLKSKGVTTIVFSDSKLSPIAQFGDYSIVTKNQKTFFGDSFTSLIGIIQGLLLHLFEANRTSVMERMEKSVQIIENNFEKK